MEQLTFFNPDTGEKLGSDKAGIIRTGLRSLRNVDRTKKKKPYDWEV